MWWMLVLSCSPKGTQVSETMAQTPAPVEESAPPETPDEDANIELDGLGISADWDDGDTFAFIDPTTGERVKARLSGFNTLESYGPVHRWGEWTGEELYRLAKQAGVRAQAGPWSCEKLPGSCGYGRICVTCPELQATLLREGLAHLFMIKGEADPQMIEHQAYAQQTGAGIWAKGVPKELVTSLHSLDEKPDRTQTYNRLISPQTGASTQLHHSENYATCDWVCPSDSCMLYVPYAQRYGDDRAPCLELSDSGN